MNIITICPCCSSPMLHYLHPDREAWFCRNCWQEMPNFSAQNSNHKNQIVNLSAQFVKRNKSVAV